MFFVLSVDLRYIHAIWEKKNVGRQARAVLRDLSHPTLQTPKTLILGGILIKSQNFAHFAQMKTSPQEKWEIPTNCRLTTDKLPTVYRRLPTNYRWLPTNYRRTTDDNRRLPTVYRRLPTVYRRLPTNYQRTTNETCTPKTAKIGFWEVRGLISWTFCFPVPVAKAKCTLVA